MKKAMLLALILVFALLNSSLNAVSDDPGRTEQAQKTHLKDECLLIAKKCGTSVVSIQDKIEKLKEEIAKGSSVYTPDELNILKQRLDEVSQTLDFLLEK